MFPAGCNFFEWASLIERHNGTSINFELLASPIQFGKLAYVRELTAGRGERSGDESAPPLDPALPGLELAAHRKELAHAPVTAAVGHPEKRAIKLKTISQKSLFYHSPAQVYALVSA